MQEHTPSASLLGAKEEQSGFSASPCSDSAGSEFSDWSDTGDLAEQLADEEDPLRIRLGDSDRELLDSTSKQRRRNRRISYQLDTGIREDKRSHHGSVNEEVHIPNPGPRQISWFEQKLAVMMSGGAGEGQMHGLTGRALV